MDEDKDLNLEDQNLEDQDLEGDDDNKNLDEDNKEDEKEDFYNPFDKGEDKKDDKEDEEKDDKEDEDNNKKVDIEKEDDSETKREVERLKVKDEITDELDDFLDDNKNEVFRSHRKELRNLAVEAKMRGIPKPIEFATRNVLSPREWMELGKKQADRAKSAIESGDLGDYTPSRPDTDSSGLSPVENLSDKELAEVMAKAERGQL